MIRKLIIGLVTLLALAMGTLWFYVASYRANWRWQWEGYGDQNVTYVDRGGTAYDCDENRTFCRVLKPESTVSAEVFPHEVNLTCSRVLFNVAPPSYEPGEVVDRRFAGFRYLSREMFHRRGGPRVLRIQHVAVPHWMPIVLFAAYPVTALVRGLARGWRRRHRRKRHRCVKCGYDLRGNVSGACPECGAETE